MFACTAYARTVFLLLLIFCLVGCSHIAHFDPQAYNNAVETKVKALLLMDKASTDYEKNIPEIDALLFSLNHSYEYAKGIAKNQDTVAQWEIMKNPERNLMGGFLKHWKDKKVLKMAFIRNAKAIIADGFDAIIGLESGKIDTADSKK